MMDEYALMIWQAAVMKKAQNQIVGIKTKYKTDSITAEWLRDLTKLSRFEQGPRLAQEYLADKQKLSEKTSDYLDLIGIDNLLIEGGGQGGAKGIRRVVFNHELPVSVSVPGLLDEEVKETQYIKKFGFDKNGKMYFTVEDEAGGVISPNDPRFSYNRYLSSMTKELNRNRVYNLIRDYSKNLLEKGSGFNADQAIGYLGK